MVKHISTHRSNITDNPSLPYLIIKPRTKEDWLKERTHGIGASECGKIMGVSKYGTAFSLFCDKTGINPPVEENWAMRQGHIYEREIAKSFQDDKGFKVIGISEKDKKDWLACSREHNFLRVSPDYLYWLKDDNGKDLPHNLFNRGILECKSSVKHFTPECLQNECLSWYCQVQYQLHVMHLKDAYLGFLCTDSLTGGEGWYQYIPYNEKFCTETLIPAIIQFWTNHVGPVMSMKNPTREEIMEYAPDITSADDVSTRYPKEEEGKSMQGDDLEDFYDKLSIYLNNRVTIKTLEKAQKDFEDYLKLHMQDSERIVGIDDKSLVTYKSSKPTMKFDSTRFKAENPDLYEQYCHEAIGARRLIIK